MMLPKKIENTRCVLKKFATMMRLLNDDDAILFLNSRNSYGFISDFPSNSQILLHLQVNPKKFAQEDDDVDVKFT
jgi:hypothetical protein